MKLYALFVVIIAMLIAGYVSGNWKHEWVFSKDKKIDLQSAAQITSRSKL